MANTFQLHILESDGTFYEGECESLIIPTTEGQYGILAHHQNMIGAILPGVITYKLPGKEKEVASVSEVATLSTTNGDRPQTVQLR